MDNNQFNRLIGRVFLLFNVETKSGLHIGGSSTGLEIGGVDQVVIRNPLTRIPYIPGSSLRGKMRSQLEKALGKEQNKVIGKQVKIHSCDDESEYKKNGGCPICYLFGVPGEVNASGPTRLIVRDSYLTPESIEKLNKAHTDLDYTELKTEVAIDRITSHASPRTIERVPAGVFFGPTEIVYNVYLLEDLDKLKYVFEGLQLVEDDYLGGLGSRGSGKVQFHFTKIFIKKSDSYAEEIIFSQDEKQVPSEEKPVVLKELDYSKLIQWAKNKLNGK